MLTTTHNSYGRLVVLFWLFILTLPSSKAQTTVGMGTEAPNPNAVLELTAENGDQGFLTPRLTTAQRTAPDFMAKLSSVDNGMLVFDTNQGRFFYWHDGQWHPLRTETSPDPEGATSLSAQHVLIGNDANEPTAVLFSQDIIVAADGSVTTTGLRGKPLSTLPPQEDQVLQYQNGEWVPTTLSTEAVNRWYSGSVDPTEGNPAEAVNGNLYFNTSTQEMFIKEGGIWKSSGKLVDPAKDIQLYFEPIPGRNNPPDPSLGKIGDIFVESDPDNDVYIKVEPDRWERLDNDN